MSDTPSQPAGWYPDPRDSSNVRYWDGQAWTNRVAAAPAAAGPAVSKKPRPFLVVAGVVAVVFCTAAAAAYVLGSKTGEPLTEAASDKSAIEVADGEDEALSGDGADDEPLGDVFADDEPLGDEAEPDNPAAAPDPNDGRCTVGETDGDLALYNWAYYISEEQVQAFADEFGIDYSYDMYDSNEAMQPIVSAGNSGYDVIIPSDYMVEIMIGAGSLLALDFGAIPNVANISVEMRTPYYDPQGEYSVPYQWGTTGIAVNTAVIGTDFPRSWGLIFDPAISGQYDGQIQMLNDPRETLGAALRYLGYSNSTTNARELGEAGDLVAATASRLAAFNTDSADELLTSGETVIGHGYSGDMFVQFLETANPGDYEYFVPVEGGTRWVDNFVVAADAPHPCTAHTFINWMLSPAQGAVLANWNYYNTPNEAAIPFVDRELYNFLTAPEVLPGGVESLEGLRDTGSFEVNYSDAFVQAKG